MWAFVFHTPCLYPSSNVYLMNVLAHHYPFDESTFPTLSIWWLYLPFQGCLANVCTKESEEACTCHTFPNLEPKCWSLPFPTSFLVDKPHWNHVEGFNYSFLGLVIFISFNNIIWKSSTNLWQRNWLLIVIKIHAR